MLEKGGTALDAVEAAVIELENHPSFNAGLSPCCVPCVQGCQFGPRCMTRCMIVDQPT